VLSLHFFDLSRRFPPFAQPCTFVEDLDGTAHHVRQIEQIVERPRRRFNSVGRTKSQPACERNCSRCRESEGEVPSSGSSPMKKICRVTPVDIAGY